MEDNGTGWADLTLGIRCIPNPKLTSRYFQFTTTVLWLNGSGMSRAYRKQIHAVQYMLDNFEDFHID